MQALLALTLQLFLEKSYGSPAKLMPKVDPRKQVIALFEENENKRETKWPTLKARL